MLIAGKRGQLMIVVTVVVVGPGVIIGPDTGVVGISHPISITGNRVRVCIFVQKG